MANSEKAHLESHVHLTAEIVAAYVSNNSIQKHELPALIASVHGAMTTLGVSARGSDTLPPIPLVSIRKSVSNDYLISLEDGQRYKSLKRHLSGHGLTPEQYRRKWNLPHDYPMVAPSYAKQRSELAKSMGLGRRTRPTEVQATSSRRTSRKGA